jgi:hypothetical protein
MNQFFYWSVVETVAETSKMQHATVVLWVLIMKPAHYVYQPSRQLQQQPTLQWQIAFC